MRVFLLCNPSSSSLPPPPPPQSPPATTTAHRPQKPLLFLPQKPSLTRSLTAAALSFNLLFISPISPLPPPSFASEFSSPVTQLECREEDQRREEENRLEKAPKLVTNEEIVKEAWEIVNESFLGNSSNRWSPQFWLVYIYLLHYLYFKDFLLSVISFLQQALLLSISSSTSNFRV